jgi:F-type H+-transporting ATPase subunit a
MRFFRTLIAAVAVGMLSFAGLAAEHAAVDAVAHEAASHGAEHAGHAVEGLPTAAPVLFHVGPLPVTNSMVLTWVVALLLVAAVKIGVGQVQLIPKGAQNFWEWLVEGLYNFVEGIIGTELVKKTFWFFSSVFILIVATNWFGLLPGVGTIGRGIPVEPGSHKLSHVTEPLLRGANADFNMTFAIALVFFACWLIWALQFNGLVGFLKHIFGPKGGTTGFMFVMMAVVFFAVGLLEIVSILFRPVSLSFRLYGNIFAGENMLEAMTHLGGGAFGWLTALPFYFMELMVGVVQALVFMLLTAVFTLLICSHSEEHGAEGHGHGHGADGHH